MSGCKVFMLARTNERTNERTKCIIELPFRKQVFKNALKIYDTFYKLIYCKYLPVSIFLVFFKQFKYVSVENTRKTSVSGRNPMRIYSHRTIKSLMDRPRFAQHQFEGIKLASQLSFAQHEFEGINLASQLSFAQHTFEDLKLNEHSLKGCWVISPETISPENQSQ